MTAAIGLAFVTFMFFGMPVAFVLGSSALIGILVMPYGLDLLPALPQQLFSSLDSFPFLTIPLFIFAGAIMSEGGIAERLMELANITVGRGRGGLGSAIIVSALFFHGISGSSSADTAAIAKVTLPGLRRQGYPNEFSTALLAAAGATSTLIPPSMDLILIGVVANMSIAGLFAAGLIPAIINALGLILLVLYTSRKHGYGRSEGRFSLRGGAVALIGAAPALFVIVIILGGILGGIFTPTEASVVAVAYGLAITAFFYRTLTWAKLLRIYKEAIEISGLVMLVIGMSALLSYALTIFQIPHALASELDSFSKGPILFLLLVQVIFFAIGMIMDTVPALLILMPVLTPMAVARGIEPIHFGILVETNIALALAHPPAGNCLFTACAIAKAPIERVMWPLLPFIAVLIITMIIITYVPDFSMFLPRRLGLTD
jgi:C4-dicarboxylate transporter DctM subunit